MPFQFSIPQPMARRLSKYPRLVSTSRCGCRQRFLEKLSLSWRPPTRLDSVLPSIGTAKPKYFAFWKGYLYEVDGRRFEAAAGDLVSVPGGDAHAFINITNKPARQLVMMLPGMDAQRFFLGLGQVLEKGHPDRDELNLLGKPWGAEFLGPPLSVKGLSQVGRPGSLPQRPETYPSFRRNRAYCCARWHAMSLQIPLL